MSAVTGAITEIQVHCKENCFLSFQDLPWVIMGFAAQWSWSTALGQDPYLYSQIALYLTQHLWLPALLLRQQKKEVCMSGRLLPIAAWITQLVANWLGAIQNWTAKSNWVRFALHGGSAVWSHTGAGTFSDQSLFSCGRRKREQRKFGCQKPCFIFYCK